MAVLLALVLSTSVRAIIKIAVVNHTDPLYWDICLEKTGEMCEYCCLEDFEWCSQDTYYCDPITDRNLSYISDAIWVLGGVTCGFPIITYVMKFCCMKRCC